MSMKFVLQINLTNNCKFFLANIAEHENFSANKYEIFMLGSVEHKKNFNLGPSPVIVSDLNIEHLNSIIVLQFEQV